MKSFDVRLRGPDGKIRGYLVENAEDWEAARDQVALTLEFAPPHPMMIAERAYPPQLELGLNPDFS